MPTLIHLVRHGETTWHVGNRYAGSTDVPLTERGKAQAIDLSKHVQQFEVTAIYSSDLQRAFQTSIPSGDVLKIPVTQDARLREVDYGTGEGLTSAEHKAKFPAVAEAFALNPADSPFPKGESGRDAHHRAQQVLDEIAAARPDSSVLVFAHATIIRLLAAGYLGLELNEYRRCFPLLDNCSISTFEVTAESTRGRMVRFNAIPR